MGTPRYADMVLHKEYTGAMPSRAQALEDLVLYVDATDGNDYNDGSADYPFQTAQGVANYLKLWNGNGFDLTIYFADGTYDGECNWHSCFNDWGFVRIIGNEATPENVIVTRSTGTTYQNVWYFQNSSSWLALSGFYFKGASAGVGYLLKFNNCSYVEIAGPTYDGNNRFGNCRVAILAALGTVMYFYQNIYMDAGVTQNYFIYSDSPASNVGVYCDLLALEGNITTTTWLYASTGSMMEVYNTSTTNAGTLTGTAWAVGDKAFFSIRESDRTAIGGSLPAVKTVGGIRVENNYSVVPSVAKASLPSTGINQGALAYVTDDVGGETLAWFDGTNWKRAYDNATVS